MNDNHDLPSDFYNEYLSNFFTHEFGVDEMIEEIRTLHDEHANNRQELLDFCYWYLQQIPTSILVSIWGASDFKTLWKMVTSPFRPIWSECANCSVPIDALVYNRTQLREFEKIHASMVEILHGDRVINYSLDNAKKHLCVNCYDELINNPENFGEIVTPEYPTDKTPVFDPNFYRKYLNSNEWQIMRRLALDYADNRCQICYSPHRLEIHHRTYERLGFERLSDLTCLCHNCHVKFHGKDGE